MSGALAVLTAYLIGAVPVGFLIARAWGVGDIRAHGSGNIGATNVLRTAGRAPAILTLVGDVAKGYLAVTAAAVVGRGEPWPVAAAGVAAIIANCWSIFLGFRGGKGVATGLGAFLYLAPLAVAPAAVVWLVITLSFRYVSLGSVLAALCVPLGTLMLGYPAPRIAACAAGAAIVILRHHENIGRLLAGSERRLGERRA
ncbi:MAG: acyl-phosphate glycerol 3-phosphate acyltransferase [Candidatus Rokubacteria bacterium 13_1_40CM_68_15]|nr:MAG: acyl-phosphate glycerol 3-phosphate acyltransferase [Candidatus Rokubacteria bacterium 13_1_40CM_68_15]